MNACMKFSTDFRRLIWLFIRTAERERNKRREGKGRGRPAERLRDATKISAPAVGVKRRKKTPRRRPTITLLTQIS